MTATLPPATDLRDCHLYRFWVRHPVTGRRVLGYVGETVRLPFERLVEHVYSQPWADTILAWEVDEVTYPGKDAVLAAEQFAVETELPIYNYEWNLNNPHRVEIWRAKEQRWTRDDAKGRPRWVPPVTKQRKNATPGTSGRGPRLTLTWRRRLVKVGLWSLTWAELGVATLGGYRQYGVHADLRTKLVSAAVISAALLAWALWRTPDTWRLWRRRLRRIRR